MVPINLVPLCPVSDELLNSFASPLEHVFRTSVNIAAPVDGAIDSVFEPSRAQYNSTLLIKYLLTHHHYNGEKILGVTSVDLFVPVLTYVFGEAQLNGAVGIMSYCRLDDALYGLDSDPILFFERSLKEAIHELGHTFGLLHCRNYDCSMHSSTTVEEVDLKGAGLCNDCRTQIGIL